MTIAPTGTAAATTTLPTRASPNSTTAPSISRSPRADGTVNPRQIASSASVVSGHAGTTLRKLVPNTIHGPATASAAQATATARGSASSRAHQYASGATAAKLTANTIRPTQNELAADGVTASTAASI